MYCKVHAPYFREKYFYMLTPANILYRQNNQFVRRVFCNNEDIINSSVR